MRQNDSRVNFFMVIVMNYEDEINYGDEINYEDMDDLVLYDHIEWNNDQSEEFSLDALDFVSW